MKRWIARAALVALALLLAAPAGAQDDDGYLGVYLTELTDGTRTALGLHDDEGVVIEQVVPGEAADDGGIQAGDVLLSLGGRAVHDSPSLGRAMEHAGGAGQKVEVVVLRSGKRQTLQVTLARRPRRGVAFFAPDADGIAAVAPEAPVLPDAPTVWSGLMGGEGQIGLRVTELTGQLAEYFGVGRGLLVTWVVPDSPAGRAGLKAGDVLVSLGGQPIARQEDLGFVLSSARRGEELPVEVVRKGQKTKLTLKR